MASMKLGSKTDAFQRNGNAWFCITGLSSDVRIEVGDTSFHLHKFPLLSKSGFLENLIRNTSDEVEEGCVIQLHDLPGGAEAFELVAKFCYNIKFELTASNVIYLRCSSEYLQMTEDYGEGNLIARTEEFLNQVVFRSWRDSVIALESCEIILPDENLRITERCIESLAEKATDGNLLGWPLIDRRPMQSPGGTFLWNGISTGARPKASKDDWWYEDVLSLSLPIYKKMICSMETLGMKPEVVAGSLISYAKRYLPVLNKRNSGETIGFTSVKSEEEQKILIEEIDNLLPMQKGLTSTKFLSGLLRTSLILRASRTCISNLEKRIGMQLDQVTLEDLLLPNFSYSMETLYNVDCVQRILQHFLAMHKETGESSPYSTDERKFTASPTLMPATKVARLIDGYLAEIASDANLKIPKFQALASSVPDYARALDDGLYRAIDIYFKAHPWLVESEREQLCRLMDCQKLSLEACTHAAQNERLPLRVIVQVLFFEQLQLKSSIAGCFLVSDNLDGSKLLKNGVVGQNDTWSATAKENQILKLSMENMQIRVSELEKECSDMKNKLGKLVKEKSTWGFVSKRFNKKIISSKMCSAGEDSVSSTDQENGKKMKPKTEKTKENKIISTKA